MIDLIGFDADDTLWHNEHLYVEARQEFRRILRAHALPADLDDVIHDIEVGNLPYYGYGVTSFVMSLIETAVRVTGGRVSGQEIAALQDLGKRMISAEVRLFDGVEETLADLSAAYPLLLITKGDLQHQQTKVARSGIGGYFAHVEVVSEKTPETYRAILARHSVVPGRFLMVGNSMRSDILPVVALGGAAVYMPNDQTWAFETADPPDDADGRFHRVETLADLPALIRELRASGA